MTFPQLVAEVQKLLGREVSPEDTKLAYAMLVPAIERSVISPALEERIARETAAIVAERMGDSAAASALRLT